LRSRFATIALEVTLGDRSDERLSLLGCKLQVLSDRWPAEHGPGAFPLELDLPEPRQLISREVPGQPFRLGFVDRPPLGHDRRACLAAQGKGAPCQFVNGAMNPRDLNGFEA